MNLAQEQELNFTCHARFRVLFTWRHLSEALQRVQHLFTDLFLYFQLVIYTLFKFSLQYCAGNRTMPFLLQMKGLRRNEVAMKTDAGITIIRF